MRVRFVHGAVFVLLLICQFSISIGTEVPDPNDSSKYLNAVRTFADNVLKYGRDMYGPKHTPLFVDGLNTETLKPLVWHCRGEEWILSNFANHQSLLRILDGLTSLTGEAKYRDAALDASAYALEHLRTPNGLLYWGGHLGWDLRKDECVSAHRQETHELNYHSPYYDLLWDVNPSETKRLMETIWGAHVLDWSKLDFNRHSSSTTEPRPAQWSHEFDDNLSCPFPSVGNNWSMAAIAANLLHTGASLAKLGNHREAIIWTKRLAKRWRSARHPITGLCGGLLSVPQEKRARKYLGHKHPNISDATMVAGWLMQGRYRFLTLCQMQVGEKLADDGFDLIRWASDDLKAFARYAYDEKSLSFKPLLTDGTKLNWREFSPGYYSPQGLAPLKVSSGMLWAYATAYRLTRDPVHWKFLRSAWRGFDLGDLGAESGNGRHLNLKLKATSCHFLYACLDLHIATEDKAFLMLAKRVADNIVAARTPDRCLPKDYFYVRTGDEYMLAVLHLVAALQGKSQKIPKPKTDSQYFHCAFSGAVGSGRTEADARVFDQPLIYNKRKGYSILLPESTKPPVSVHEAIAMDNREIVSSLVAQKDDIENWYSLLSLAVQSGHKDIVELLLAKGFDVSVKVGWKEETPLHCAAMLKTGRDIVELLVTNSADLDAKNWKGDTPLQYAAYADHKEIIESLLQKGALITNIHIASYMGDLENAQAFINRGVEINATDGHGYAPLHYAARNNQREVAELLIVKGADVNVKNWSGQTPLDLAVRQGHKGIAEFFLSQEAHIDVDDNEGNTSLHRAAQNSQKEMTEFLIAKGADVHAVNNEGHKPIEIALQRNLKDMVELYISSGADINTVDSSGLTLLHHAAGRGQKEIVGLLLANGADINVKNNEGQTPVDVAVSRNRSEVVQLLIERGADVSLHVAARFGTLAKVKSLMEKGKDIDGKDISGRTALLYAAENGHKDAVEWLIANGADVNIKDKDGNTPGHIALGENRRSILELLIAKGANIDSIYLSAYQGDLDEVRSYIEEGADVGKVDSFGATPLHYAARRGHKEVVEFLVAKGSDVNAKDKNNNTALHSAAGGGHKDVVALLIDNGGDINARGRWDYTPIYAAAWSGITEVVELLVEKGADINVRDQWGWTPLHYMAQHDYYRHMAEFLITKGANVNAEDKWGETPLQVAERKGHTEIVELLRKHGAKE